ncbi:BMP family ABC transporter substrate-binding protein, partial [Salmonella enterica subsp. enterica serovar Oranienburg]|nr:BMP family ABC transporter substrate-binding protein [Salmonella enterica subsp. enterica serovar Oranienburg]
DKSCNEYAKKGLDEAAATLGVTPVEVQSSSANDYAPNLESLVAANCTLIISVGFNLAADTVKSALANPNLQYAIVDDSADLNNDGKTDAPNI